VAKVYQRASGVTTRPGTPRTRKSWTRCPSHQSNKTNS